MANRAATQESIREPQLKAAVIDALFRHQMIDDDAVVISEMPMPHGDRRADLVLANGKLIGFELKSAADRTVRLAAQADAFLAQLEGLVVVVDERHLEDAERLLPLAAGIFTSCVVGDEISIEIHRKMRVRVLDRHASVRLMHASDLQKLARQHDLPTQSTSRYGLELAVECLPPAVIRRAAIDSVKRRYRSYFEAFREHRAQSCSRDGLQFLRKPAWQQARTHRPDPLPAPTVDASPKTVELPLRVTPRAVKTEHRPPVDQHRSR